MVQDTNYLRLGMYDTEVVGIQEFLGEVEKGEAVTLVRNPLDHNNPNAIKVMNRECKQIGHLPKSVACGLASFIDDERLTVRGVVKWTGVRDKYADALPLCMTLHVKESKILGDAIFEVEQRRIRTDALQGPTSTAAAVGQELAAATSQVPRTPGFCFTAALEPEAITGSTFYGFYPPYCKFGPWKSKKFSYLDVNGTVHDTVELRNCVLETRNGPQDALYATSQKEGFIRLHVRESDAQMCFQGIIDGGEFARKFVGVGKKIRYFQDIESGSAHRIDYCVFSPEFNNCQVMKVGRHNAYYVNVKDEVRRAYAQGQDLQVTVVGRPKVSKKTVASSGRSCEIHINFILTQILIVGNAPKATKYEDPLLATRSTAPES